MGKLEQYVTILGRKTIALNRNQLSKQKTKNSSQITSTVVHVYEWNNIFKIINNVIKHNEIAYFVSLRIMYKYIQKTFKPTSEDRFWSEQDFFLTFI